MLCIVISTLTGNTSILVLVSMGRLGRDWIPRYAYTVYTCHEGGALEGGSWATIVVHPIVGGNCNLPTSPPPQFRCG